MHDDMKLAQRIQQKDPRAFAEFLDAYGAGVQRLVRQYVRNRTDAEDVLQEIFCDLYRSIGGFQGHSALATWVYRVAVNHCLKYRQRAQPDNVPYEDETVGSLSDWRSDPAQMAEKCELAERVRCALEGLSPRHHDVVILCEMLGLTYQECAEVLDIPVGTVKSRLSYAFRNLRLSLGGYVLGNGSAPRLKTARERSR
jgi:RNA polymerase sigma-70 factor (ECF subfamily)